MGKMLNKLEFNEAEHIYKLDGRVIPSVTDALSLVDDRRKDPYYLQRGRFIHLACELWDKGELDESTIDPEILPRLEAWKLFRKEIGFIPSRIEEFYVHPVYLYGFKFDRTGPLNRREVLIDLKSSPHRCDELQGAAYWAGLEAQTPPILTKDIFDIYLKDNGRYDLRPVKRNSLRSKFNTFLAILTAYRWKMKGD